MLKFNKLTRFISLIGVITIGTFGCSSESANQFSPEQVINNALEEPTAIKPYYAEAEMRTKENGLESETIFIKEWMNEDGKKRIEVESTAEGENSIAVNDGTKLISYQPKANQAFVIESEDLLTLNNVSPKQQAEQLLKVIRDTHEINAKGEEEVSGRQTFHIVAKAKEENSIFGDQEFWIDKESWLVLRMISNSGDMNMEMEYTKIEFNADIPDKTFILDLPEDVEIQNLDDLNQTNEVTLNEAVTSVGKPFLHFPETEEVSLERVEVLSIQGEVNRNEVNIDYHINGLPAFTMTVFESPEDLDEDMGTFPGEKTTTIRKQEAIFMEMNGLRSLNWQEKGLSYSIIFVDPSLPFEKVEALTEEMLLVE